MSYPEEPMTRQEQYLDAIARGETDGMPAVPNTRMEMYLDAIARNGGGGGGAVIAGKYDPAEAYAIGDHTINGGKLYVKTSGAEAAEEWTPAHWTEVTVGEEISQLSSSIADTYNPLNIYEEGDFAIKDGKLCVYTGGVWVETKIVDNFGQGGGGIDEDVFDFARFGGKRLNDVFADADALHAAIEAGDFSKIHVGDYWEITLNGTYRDYGVFMLPAGSKYYSDANCTDEVGTTDADANVVPESNTDSCSFKVSGTTRYCKIGDATQHYVEQTLTNSVLRCEVAGINPYYCYGDSGDLSDKKNHVCFVTKDGFGKAIAMRPSNVRWVDEQEESFEVESATGTFTLSDNTKKIRSVRINGTLKTYDTHYTVSGVAATLKAAAGAAVGDTLTIQYTDDDVCWNGSNIKKTFNDEDYGIAKLIKTADAKLFSHLTDMRIYNETLPVTGTFGTAWSNRGKIFLPLESEVWGEVIYGHAANVAFRPQLPIFTDGTRRYKGVSNGSGRATWWVGSFYSTTYACNVHYYGIEGGNLANLSSAAPLGFVVI